MSHIDVHGTASLMRRGVRLRSVSSRVEEAPAPAGPGNRRKAPQMSSSVILGTARTPGGKRGGALASLEAPELGGIAIEAALERSGVGAEQVQQVIFGQVLQAGQGQIPSRQAPIKQGTPKEVPYATLNKDGA